MSNKKLAGIGPAARSWGNSGAAARPAGPAWLREIERVLGATLAGLRELVVGLRDDNPAKRSRGR